MAASGRLFAAPYTAGLPLKSTGKSLIMCLCRVVEVLGYILNKPESAISHSPWSGIMINNPMWRLGHGVGLFRRDQCIKDNWLYSDGMLRSNSQYSRKIVNMVKPIICCNYVYTHEYCY